MDLYLKFNQRIFTTHWIEKAFNNKFKTNLKFKDLIPVNQMMLYMMLDKESLLELTRKSKKHHSVTLNGETFFTVSLYIENEKAIAERFIYEQLKT